MLLMNKYQKMADAAEITNEGPLPILEGDSDEVKTLKSMPLFMFDFSKVPNFPVVQMGEHANTEEEAKAGIAERLKEFI